MSDEVEELEGLDDEPAWIDYTIDVGCVHIAHLHEFYTETKSIASKFDEHGVLWVLDSETLQWFDVTTLRKPEPKPKTSGKVSAIR